MKRSKWQYGTKVHITKELLLSELNSFINGKEYFNEFKALFDLWLLDDEDNITVADETIDFFLNGLHGDLIDIDIDRNSYSVEILKTCRHLLENDKVTAENMSAAVHYASIYEYFEKLKRGVITKEILRNYLQKRIAPYDDQFYENVIKIYQNKLFHQFWNFS